AIEAPVNLLDFLSVAKGSLEEGIILEFFEFPLKVIFSEKTLLVKNTIKNNTCINSNHWGIYLQSSDTCLLTYNLIQNSAEHGIYLNANSYDNVVHHNTFASNNLGGNSQGYDAGTNNIWFDTITLEGNWWSDWAGVSSYPLDGEANNNDPFPDGPIVISEFSAGIHLIFLLSVSSVVVVTLSIITKNRLKNY
ncbi:MAG: right-handed parallel beta-helix repeat-containing protein, partial [Candidatus Heimdallarchaeota archaeon]|nr:right-handed parallel beta-helix repeat-containing protein [Candidatus Heimdallarchaeota archaeon]